MELEDYFLTMNLCDGISEYCDGAAIYIEGKFIFKF